MAKKISLTSKLSAVIQISTIILVLYLSSLYNYVLFHSLAEAVSLVIAFGIFSVTWNSRRYTDNHYFVLIGIVYLFVGAVDLLHLLAYKGMGVFVVPGANLATQLWLVGRYIDAVAFVLAPLFITRKINTRAAFFICIAGFSAFLLSIFYWHNFPAAYIEGIGLTKFKIYSEYAIIAAFVVAILLAYQRRQRFDKSVFQFIVASLLAKIAAEICFTRYFGVYDYANMFGHFFKVSSFFLFYLGIVEIGLMKPYRLLFKNLKDNEVALRQSEERYRSLVELSPDAILVHFSGIIAYINQAGINLLGAADKKDVINKNLLDFIHPEYQELIRGRMKRLDSGEVKETPLRDAKLVTIDGRVLDIEVKGALVNYQGEKAIQTIIHDVTNRQIAIEDASDHIAIINPHGKIVYANKAAERMTGYSRSEMIGKNPGALWGNCIGKNLSMNFAVCQNAWDQIGKDSPSFSGEVVNKKKNGDRYLAELHVSPVFDEKNEVDLFIAIERDITRMKEVDRAKTEFVSLASHQLRTPLASISLSSELLLRGIAGPIDDNLKNYLEEIYASTQKMSELIEDLLNISRIELGTFEVRPEPTDVVNVADGILSQLTVQFNHKHLVLDKKFEEGLPIVNFDKTILSTAVENVVSNSIRYTPDGGKISIEIAKNDNQIIIKVTDTGCGIPKHQHHKIFGKLFRADNAKEIVADGTGLGLYIVKSMLKKANSKIWFESEEGKGSVFYISIPVHEERPGQQ